MGLDLGMEHAGFDILLAAELDPMARATIEANRPKLPLLGDVSKVTASDVRRNAGLGSKEMIDLVFGGPPCQAFSTAGKRQGFNDTRGNVFLDYIDLVIALRPRFAVIENVRGLLSAPLVHRPHDQRGKGFPKLTPEESRGGALREILKRLDCGGYNVSFNLYNTANFGTPQIRERVVLVCSLNGKKPPYLTPTHGEEAEDLLPWKTFRQATTGLLEKNARHVNFPEKRLEYYRRLGPGQNWRDLPPRIQPLAMGKSYFAGGGKTGFYRRLAWNKPSPTVVTHPAMPATDLAHPVKDRPLSIQEYVRLQEFPDDWKVSGKLVDQYKQIGNAVPVGFATVIGRLVAGLLNGQQVDSPKMLRSSRYIGTDDVSWLQTVAESEELALIKS